MASEERDVLFTGQKFGRLTVVGRTFGTHYPEGERINYKCLCECGNTTVAGKFHLKRGETVSCGCKKMEIGDLSRIHSMSGSPLYWSWAHMVQRCKNPATKEYPDYGGRGIIIEDGWEDFTKFYTDMGECPEGYTLDRIDVHGNYSKENCRWADDFTQASNKRRRTTNKSGRTGVSFHKASGCWEAGLTFRRVVYYGGRHKRYEDAVRAREQLELQHFGVIRTEEYENRPDLENSLRRTFCEF